MSRRIDASAHELFEVVRDPRRHQEFDGSSIVRESDAPPIQAVGDTFIMRMHNDEFGDYEMRNEGGRVHPGSGDRVGAQAPRRG